MLQNINKQALSLGGLHHHQLIVNYQRHQFVYITMGTRQVTQPVYFCFIALIEYKGVDFWAIYHKIKLCLPVTDALAYCTKDGTKKEMLINEKQASLSHKTVKPIIKLIELVPANGRESFRV